MEQKVGDNYNMLANRSCNVWGQKEIELERLYRGIDYNPIVGITDGQGSKRSFGTSFSSLSGSSALVGLRTFKVLDFACRQRHCQCCARGVPLDKHSVVEKISMVLPV